MNNSRGSIWRKCDFHIHTPFSALENKFDKIEFYNDPVFGIAVPKECPCVPPDILSPRSTWANQEAYDERAKYVATLFVRNFEKYASGVNKEVLAAAPNL